MTTTITKFKFKLTHLHNNLLKGNYTLPDEKKTIIKTQKLHKLQIYNNDNTLIHLFI